MPARVLLLSNGHGEDLSGALIGACLQRQGVQVSALPLVGHGEPYRRRAIPVLGRTRAFSTGGLGFTSLAGQVRELLEGQTLHVIVQLARLRSRSRAYDLVVAVGDLVAVLGGWLSGRPTAVYLVAYSSHYEGRLRLPWPCGWLLRRRRIGAIWSRDRLTAADLSGQLGRSVRFLGNPFLDAALDDSPSRRSGADAAGQHLLLLPGSRLPEAEHNLTRMLQLLPRLAGRLEQPRQLRIGAALVGDLRHEAIARLAEPLGWRVDPDTDVGLRHPCGLAVALVWGDFPRQLAAADLVLAMAGTATEQAAGLGKPVLQLVGRGPQFTPGFAEAQRRLLGPGVMCAPGEPDSPAGLEATAELAAQLLQRLADPQRSATLRRGLTAEAAERIGAVGGSERLAAAIMDLLGRGSAAA